MTLVAAYLALVVFAAGLLYVLGATGRACRLLGDPDVNRTAAQVRRDDGRFAQVNLAAALVHLLALAWLVAMSRLGHDLVSWAVLGGLVPLVFAGTVLLHASIPFLHGKADAPGRG